MYGAVDLIIVGQFGGDCADAFVSAVSTGSQIMLTLTVVIIGLVTLIPITLQLVLCVGFFAIERALKKTRATEN